MSLIDSFLAGFEINKIIISTISSTYLKSLNLFSLLNLNRFSSRIAFVNRNRVISGLPNGQEKRYFHTSIGINGRFDSIQEAILLAKLEFYEIKLKIEINWQKYIQRN